jgi:PAS domain S-box-containing protein
MDDNQTRILSPQTRDKLDSECAMRNQLRSIIDNIEVFEAMYSSLVAQLPLGILIHDRETVQFANPYGAEILGGRSTDIAGLPLERVVHESCYQEFRDRFDSIRAGESIKNPQKVVFVRLDGTPIRVSTVGVPVQIQDRLIAQVVFVDEGVLEHILDLSTIRGSESSLNDSAEQ